MVIKHPIDLSKIQLFFEDGKYKRAETFASDILLMVQNCVLFNSRDAKSQKYVRLAKLWRKFVKVFTLFIHDEGIVFTQPSMLDNEDIWNLLTQCVHAKCLIIAVILLLLVMVGVKGGIIQVHGLIRCGDFSYLLMKKLEWKQSAST